MRFPLQISKVGSVKRGRTVCDQRASPYALQHPGEALSRANRLCRARGARTGYPPRNLDHRSRVVGHLSLPGGLKSGVNYV